MVSWAVVCVSASSYSPPPSRETPDGVSAAIFRGAAVERILLTGIAGFIGSHLAESLLAGGCAVRGVDAFTDTYAPAQKRANAAAVSRSAPTARCCSRCTCS